MDVTMDNQQVRPLEIAWLAGIIEGEGYIGLSCKVTGDFQYLPRVQIINSDMTLLEEASKILKNHDVPHYIMHRKPSLKGLKNNRRVTDLRITGISRVAKVLELVAPLMRGEKKARAEVILKFCQSRMGVYKNTPYQEVEHSLYQDFRKLVENPRDYTLNPTTSG